MKVIYLIDNDGKLFILEPNDHLNIEHHEAFLIYNLAVTQECISPEKNLSYRSKESNKSFMELRNAFYKSTHYGSPH